MDNKLNRRPARTRANRLRLRTCSWPTARSEALGTCLQVKRHWASSAAGTRKAHTCWLWTSSTCISRAAALLPGGRTGGNRLQRTMYRHDLATLAATGLPTIHKLQLMTVRGRGPLQLKPPGLWLAKSDMRHALEVSLDGGSPTCFGWEPTRPKKQLLILLFRPIKEILGFKPS